MPEPEPTCIGRVRHVLGSTVTVALDPDLAGVAPLYRGRLQPVGQIGSLVRIPQGLVDLVAVVTLVGIAELAGNLSPADVAQRGERWLRVELLGEIDRATHLFHRGVGTYPGLDDPVHFATPEQLGAVFPMPDSEHLRLGRLAAAEDIPVSLHANRLVVRHAAVVGSTGSGKTSAVAAMLQSFVRGGWSRAHILVIDPHGEYSRAMEKYASVRSVLGAGAKQLRVPYWALPAREILRIFTASIPGATAANRFSELVGEGRRKFVEAAEWISLDPSAVTPDTPVPFDIRPIWRQMDRENRETRTTVGDPATARVIDEGDEATLRPTQFEPYGPAGRPPQKGPLYSAHGTIPDLLRLGLLDPRMRFFQEPVGDVAGPDPLVQVMVEWLGSGRPVSVLDFSGVPGEAADVAIGVVLNLVFEVALRTQSGDKGIGRPSPVMVVLEEAHRYLGGEATALTRESANRIAREGRKYGVGLLMVSQRPTELPKTALAQCGTIVALRLSNAEDQGAIRAALPDSVAGLAAILPSLRTGEAIVSGEAVVIPSRLLIDQPDPKPLAEDPSLASWRSSDYEMDLAPAIKAWRGTYQGET